MTAASATQQCYHCGLPLPATGEESLEIFGQRRGFCCHGCRAVCETIVAAGLGDYYRNREGYSGTVADIQDRALENFSIYDNEQVQSSFVQRSDGWQEAYLILEGIRCSACVWLNELQLRRQDGVLEVHIDEVSQRARVRWDPDSIKLSQILAAIAEIGYQAHPYEPSHYRQLQQESRRKNLQRLIYAAFVGMLPMHFALATWFMGGLDSSGELANWERLGRWTSLFITLTILLYPAQEFFFGLWSDLRRRVIGMDVPIVLGLVSAFLLSAYSTVIGYGEVYYESITMFVLFILISRRLEYRARVQASDQLERLALAQPQEANLLDEAGQTQRVSVKQLVAGQRIRILPGEQVPVDCCIIEGRSAFDESLITGESDEVPHGAGNNLIAGSVNFHQPVVAETLSDEMGSTIMQITRLAEAGLQQKPLQTQIADKIAARFVSIILLLAGATAAFWFSQGSDQWLVYAISVLIVTCPCALALATPIALTMGSSLALKKGLLPMNMSVLGKLARLDTFVFDKTGTLTLGRLVLVDQRWHATDLEKDGKLVLMAMTRQSEHPVSRALKNMWHGAAELDAVENHVGQGISAQWRCSVWRFGRADFALEGEPVQSELTDGSTSYLSCDGVLVAALVFQDQPRPSATQTIKELKQLDVRSVILSGDVSHNVAVLAESVGVAQYQGELLPQQKMQWVQRQQQKGGVVAMIGDGINDAPTLACADVSFSFKESTNLANLHSDFVLLAEDLTMLPGAVRLARKTLRTIRQNIGWAVAYNLIVLPLAMAGLVSPWMAALGMSLSSIIVVLNSIRLKRALT